MSNDTATASDATQVLIRNFELGLASVVLIITLHLITYIQNYLQTRFHKGPLLEKVNGLLDKQTQDIGMTISKKIFEGNSKVSFDLNLDALSVNSPAKEAKKNE